MNQIHMHNNKCVRNDRVFTLEEPNPKDKRHIKKLNNNFNNINNGINYFT